MTSKQNWQIAQTLDPPMRPPSLGCKICGERLMYKFATVSGRYCLEHLSNSQHQWQSDPTINMFEREITALTSRKWGNATTGDYRGIPGSLNPLNCGSCIDSCIGRA